jgi:large subunit ribosomal protein L16
MFMLTRPRQTKYNKVFKGKLNGYEQKVIFSKGGHALKTLELGRISAKQMEALRKVITRKLKRMGQVEFKMFPHIPLTKKPIETRMGKGKGQVTSWVAHVKPGRVLCIIYGVQPALAYQALKSASAKLSVKTWITSST